MNTISTFNYMHEEILRADSIIHTIKTGLSEVPSFKQTHTNWKRYVNSGDM